MLLQMYMYGKEKEQNYDIMLDFIVLYFKKNTSHYGNVTYHAPCIEFRIISSANYTINQFFYILIS